MKVTIMTVHIYKLANQLHESTVSLSEKFSLYAVIVARWPAVICETLTLCKTFFLLKYENYFVHYFPM